MAEQKVLYIGVYRDDGGWSAGARANILAMDAVGIDVVPRCITFTKSRFPPPARLVELEKKNASGANIVIQHILPHTMEYNGYFDRNIGVYYTETSNFLASNWPEKLNYMTELWASSKQMVEAAKASHVFTPTKIIPYSVDISKFQQSYQQFSIKPQTNSFVFYTISSGIRRKNLAALVKAFHIEFEDYEPVELLIKTEASIQEMTYFCDSIKQGLKVRTTYKPEIIMSEYLTEHDLYRLHNSCDCFVSTSYGEAVCIPAIEALGFGKTPIVPNWGGYIEYIDDEVGWLIPTSEEVCFGINDSFNDLYTAKECWASVSVPALCRIMRECYENTSLRTKKSEAGLGRVFNFGYDIIGEQIKRVLV
jgi:glycosyltransferase involved in cell wall biosynthesis